MNINLPSEETISNLKSTTKQVFNDCLMPNGCIIAAPSHMPYYPKDAKSYLYCWPGRDNGFNLAAMILLGEDHYETFLNWVWNRAEDFQTSIKPAFEGLIYRSYHPNGLVREHQFQPDQGATLIWSLKFKNEITGKSPSNLEKIIVNKIAESYVREWEDEGFKLAVEDIWEERGRNRGEGNFTYSIAACSRAMKIAYEMIGNKSFLDLSENMKESLIRDSYMGDIEGLPRTYGGTIGTDATIDGSLSGLVWPFNIGFEKNRLETTLSRIEQELLTQSGVYRYAEDEYEGRGSRHGINEKAGPWPLLTFWLSIAHKELGNDDKAKQYFGMVFEHLEDQFIPEQIFKEHEMGWTGIKPLLWSHSMAVIAAWKLGIL